MIRYLIASAIGMMMVAASGGLAAAQDTPAHGFAQPLAQPMIAGIQQNLTELGYYAGPVDGQLNAGTTAAIRMVQKIVGVAADGRADQGVANLLNFADVPARDGAALTASGQAASKFKAAMPSTGKRAPESDPYLKAAQKKLKAMGLYDGAIDGLMGPKSEQALIDFRVEQGLKGPARLTPELLAAIMSAESPDAGMTEVPDNKPTPDADPAPEPAEPSSAAATTSTGEPAPTPRPHMSRPDVEPRPEAETFEPMPRTPEGNMPTDSMGDPMPEAEANEDTPAPGSRGRAGYG